MLCAEFKRSCEFKIFKEHEAHRQPCAIVELDARRSVASCLGSAEGGCGTLDEWARQEARVAMNVTVAKIADVGTYAWHHAQTFIEGIEGQTSSGWSLTGGATHPVIPSTPLY
jgi:hypothetical protein